MFKIKWEFFWEECLIKKDFHKLLVFHSLWKSTFWSASLSQLFQDLKFCVVSAPEKTDKWFAWIQWFGFCVIIAFNSIDKDIGFVGFWIIIAFYSIVPGYWFLLVFRHHRFLGHRRGYWFCSVFWVIIAFKGIVSECWILCVFNRNSFFVFYRSWMRSFWLFINNFLIQRCNSF